jgi:hypothetical protein
LTEPPSSRLNPERPAGGSRATAPVCPMAAGPVALVLARVLERHLSQPASRQRSEGFGNRREVTPKDLDASGLEFHERALADTTDHQAIHGFAGESREWLTHAVGVMCIPVRQRPTRESRCVYEEEDRR